MASGYNAIMYRLSGMVPSDRPSPSEDIESLKDSLSAYFLGDSLDEVSRDLCWNNFAIPALLITLHDFMESDAHRIRINEFFYRRLDDSVQAAVDHELTPAELAIEREDRVFGAMSLVIDKGSESNVLAQEDLVHLVTFLYEFFPGLEEFLRLVNPTANPFISGTLSLNRLSDYLISIQVFFFFDMFILYNLYYSPLTGCHYESSIVIRFTGVAIPVCNSRLTLKILFLLLCSVVWTLLIF